MKKLILIIHFLVLNLGFSQGLSFENSIEWSKNSDLFLLEHGTIVPYFKVCVRNLSNESIYFYNPFYKKTNYPRVLDHSIHRLPYKDKLIRELINKHALDSVTNNVLMGNFGMDKEPSFIVFDNLSIDDFLEGKEYDPSYRGSELSLLYNLLELQNYYNDNNIKRQTVLFNDKEKETISKREIKSDISVMRKKEQELAQKNESLMDTSNMLIFLKPGEFIEIRFNLIAFKMIGGEYIFGLNFNQLRNFFLINEGDEVKKEKLPDSKNGYKLYEGSFVTNLVKVKF